MSSAKPGKYLVQHVAYVSRIFSEYIVEPFHRV